MGRAGVVLKQILAAYGISQNKLAIAMGVRRWDVGRWVHEHSDPTGDSIVAIALALKQIHPEAAREFVRLYLGDLVDDQEQAKGEE